MYDSVCVQKYRIVSLVIPPDLSRFQFWKHPGGLLQHTRADHMFMSLMSFTLFFCTTLLCVVHTSYYHVEATRIGTLTFQC